MKDDLNQEVAKELVAQTVGKAYEDIARPAAHAVGQIVSFIPRTIRIWLSKWEKWILNGECAIAETEKLLERKLNSIPEEKIVEPEPYVAVPAIQQLSYSIDNPDLREMYANLLASSMNIDTKWNVHPSFVEIIRQLTPDEAKLLKKISKDPSYPLIEVELTFVKGEGYSVVLSNFSDIADGICDNPRNVSSYIENLCRLGIIEIPAGVWINDKKIYERLKNHPIVQKSMEKPVPVGAKYDFEEKCFRLTSFGEKFIKVTV